jgi:hypothetical protein
MGCGEKTGVIGPAPGKPGILKNMPEGISGPSRHKTLGDKIQARRVFTVGKTVKFPAKKFIMFAGRRYPFQDLCYINTYPRLSTVTGEGVYSYLHVYPPKTLELQHIR